MQQVAGIPVADGGAFAARRPAAPITRRRRRRPRPNRHILKSGLLGGLLLASLGLGLLALDSHRLSLGTDRIDRVLVAAGLGVDEIVVTGYRFTTDLDIFDALGATGRTMLDLDAAAARARIERLPWVLGVSLTRVYPGRIEVAVSERTPYAVWLDGDAAALIDATGRKLSAVPATAWPSLPRLKGKGAPDVASALYGTLAHYPAVASRLQLAERVGDRRWRLHLTRGLRIELPPEGEAAALSALLDHPAAARLMAEDGNLIDLRSQTRLAARIDGGA